MDKINASINVVEAAELLQVTPRHVVRLIHRGDFQSVYKLPGIRGAFVLNRSEVLSKVDGE